MVAALRKPTQFASIWQILTFASAAILIGAVLLRDRPDLALLPEMAPDAVIMRDGARLYVQKYEVTVAEWNRCHADGACTLELRAPSGQSPAQIPATGLSFVDVREYLFWIRERTGTEFRLPTLEEWSFMAAEVLPEAPDPIFTAPELTWASAYLTEGLTPRVLLPKGSFKTSKEGISDLDGSVWEWTQDCFVSADSGMDPNRCPAYLVGGEHIAAMSYLVRDPARGGCAVGAPPAHLGMRLVSDKPFAKQPQKR